MISEKEARPLCEFADVGESLRADESAPEVANEQVTQQLCEKIH